MFIPASSFEDAISEIFSLTRRVEENLL
jgi:hypothetical protein